MIQLVAHINLDLIQEIFIVTLISKIIFLLIIYKDAEEDC